MNSLPTPEGVVTGNSKGIETTIIEWALDEGIPHTIVEPNYRLEGLSDARIFEKRNLEILVMSDEVVLFWDGEAGVIWSILLQAITLKKRIHVIPLP